MKNLTFKTHKNTNIQAELLTRFLNTPGVTVDFCPENEDLSPLDLGIEDAKTLRWISGGSLERWFSAKVTVIYRGIEISEYLGGCSYRSFAEFKTDAYYFDMITACVNQINSEINQRNDGICRNFKIRNLLKLATELNYLVIPRQSILN